ncbi:M23 family metallopeptidase [Falsiroseomonas sp.]|uniref:M23 family metallopeptidase n=1 Tax=Falsiroseomonas sp. TaxID=2870721 RepID=UPI0035669FD0
MRGALGALIAAALSGAAAAEPVRLALPLTPACISSPFGPRGAPGPRGSSLHRGLDIPAPAGAWARAAAAGTVTAIRRRGGRGLEVELRHADGRVTRYAHLGSVAPRLAGGGRRVAAGERIGRIGRSGITYGTHLHLELLEGGQPVDPAPAFGLLPCLSR